MKWYLLCISLLILLMFFFVLVIAYVHGINGPKGPVSELGVNTSVAELQNGNVRYQYEQSEKEGASILFLHGFNGNLNQWEPTWQELNDCGPRIRLDIPGYGNSNWLSDDYTVPTQGERIIELMDYLHVQNVVLVGISMGGSISAWLAANHPERVKGLILIAPSGYPGSLTYGGRWNFFFRPGYANELATLIVKSKIFKKIFRNSKSTQALSVTSSYGEVWRELLSHVRQYTLILWSSSDIAVPIEYAEKINLLIENSKVILLNKSVGHEVHKNNPSAIANLSCLYLTGLLNNNIEDLDELELSLDVN